MHITDGYVAIINNISAQWGQNVEEGPKWAEKIVNECYMTWPSLMCFDLSY